MLPLCHEASLTQKSSPPDPAATGNTVHAEELWAFGQCFPGSATKKNPMCNSRCAWYNQLTGFLWEIFLTTIDISKSLFRNVHISINAVTTSAEKYEKTNIFLTEWVCLYACVGLKV